MQQFFSFAMAKSKAPPEPRMERPFYGTKAPRVPSLPVPGSMLLGPEAPQKEDEPQNSGVAEARSSNDILQARQNEGEDADNGEDSDHNGNSNEDSDKDGSGAVEENNKDNSGEEEDSTEHNVS